MTEPNTQTVCHPKAEAAAAEEAAPAAVTPESGMELYDLADYWLGCHVYLNADNTFTLTYDYNEENSGILSASGSWERISDTELVLHPETGEDILVTLADGVWSCEVTEPNTQTVCRPRAEGGATETAAVSNEKQKYLIVFTEADGTVYSTVETEDASVVPEVEIPVREGFAFAGWQTRPNVTKEELILGVSPYEVPTGSSSLYGGAGTAITGLESMNGNMLLLYPRWVEITEIHNADELRAMAEDLCGSYVLAEDIDLAGEEWLPIGTYFSNYETVNAAYWTYAFRGSLDGAGHRILGLHITACSKDPSMFQAENAVWRNDGVCTGGEAAMFGALAKADIRNLTLEKAVIEISSENDATPYVAVLGGFDLGSHLEKISVNEPQISVSVSDRNANARASAWAAVSGLVAGGWSNTIKDCVVREAAITVNGISEKSHGGEYYVGSMLGEGYAFMDGNKATGRISVSVEDKSTAEADAELIVNVGGMGGTNTTQTNGEFDTQMNVRVSKPVGAASVSIGGLAGSQRYQVAEENRIKAEIATDCELDPEKGKLYVGKVIGSTNIPYCIVQMIFADPDSVDFSGCRNNEASVSHNGSEVMLSRGEILSLGTEELTYIANGDVTLDGTTYVSNINEVIAEYGSAVPSSFLQRCVIVLVNE